MMQANTWQTYTGQNLSFSHTIHIFKINADDYINSCSTSLLSDEELNKAMRFHNQIDQGNYIVRKSLLRLLSARILSRKANDIQFLKTANKKPYLPEINFNCSHSKNLVTIAFSTSEIGVDIEFINEGLDFNSLIDHCFSAQEASAILGSEQPRLNFYTLWTRKEALLKATGEGLIDDLPQIPVLGAKIYRKNTFYDVQSIWSKYYVLSICYPENDQVTLRLWDKIDPLVFSTF